MSNTSDVQVLIAGGGPIGLTAAIELARRGVAYRIVDPLVEPPQYAKAVGVQTRTLEVLYAPDGPFDIAAFERAATATVSATHGRMDVYLIAAPGADVAATELPLIRDTAGDFARAYAPTGPSAYVVRPDGYLGLAAACVDPAQLVAHLGATFARPEGDVSG
jgi:hypothetical protein